MNKNCMACEFEGLLEEWKFCPRCGARQPEIVGKIGGIPIVVDPNQPPGLIRMEKSLKELVVIPEKYHPAGEPKED